MPGNILIKKIRKACARHGMFAPGDKVTAAVSGGPDSVAMLCALLEMKDELGISLSVAHLDHGFREESGAEAEFVLRMAETLGIPFYTEKARLGERLTGVAANRQEAAREARYEFLERAADYFKSDKIAVAHTAGDQAETVLMRLLRGSGMTGLAGIPPVGRPINPLRRTVVRPLIYASREDVESYLSEKKIEYISDPSNLKKIYIRNRLRLELIPALKEYNPNVIEAVSRSAELLRADEEFMDDYARERTEALIARRYKGLVALNLDGFEKLPEAIKRRALRIAVEEIKGDTRSLTYDHILDAALGISEGATGRGVDLPGGVRVERSYKELLIYRPEGHIVFNVPLPLPDEAEASSCEIPEIGIRVEAEIISEPSPVGAQFIAPDTAIFDLDKMRDPLIIRNRRPGDYFYPAGMQGKKKIKEFFIDLKLSRAERARVPLLECGGEIAWVMGHRQDRRFTPGPETKNFIRIRLIK